MFNKDALFGKKDEAPRSDARAVNITPDLHGGVRQAATDEALRYDRVPSEPARAARTAEEPAGSRLTVGPDIKLKGVEITDCDTLLVEGRVEASMESRVVQIAEHGVYSGKATMDVAEIWGTFEGELTVRNQLVIHGTGRVSGQIRYGRIRIEEGAELSGDVSTLRSDKPARPESARGESAPPVGGTPARGGLSGPASQSPVRPGAAASR